jgi:hypothetical protein
LSAIEKNYMKSNSFLNYKLQKYLFLNFCIACCRAVAHSKFASASWFLNAAHFLGSDSAACWFLPLSPFDHSPGLGGDGLYIMDRGREAQEVLEVRNSDIEADHMLAHRIREIIETSPSQSCTE